MEANGVVHHSIVAIHIIACPVAHTCANGKFLPAFMKCTEALPESQHTPTEC